MAAHKALGRGLEALFSSHPSRPKQEVQDSPEKTSLKGASGPHVREIPVGNIKPNRHQPRTEFDQEALAELAQSIRSHGLAQPLLVTESGTPGEYELVAGERRLRASKMAGLASVPCTIRSLTNRQRFEVALVENLQREDLNALEEATALDGLMKEYDLTQEDVANAIGKSRSTVANILRLLRLHADVQAAVRAGSITEGHAKCLAGLSEHTEQLQWLVKIIEDHLSVRDLESLLSEQPSQKKSNSNRLKQVLPEVLKYQEELQRQLSRRVEIQTNGKKGWLKFEFYNPEDLDVLLKKMGLKV
ncbi:MAG: Stage 0 sporulation protein J [Elusimicrobia bacterium]|nr:Stage 0 sporulation protein J [Elusimicrobiota bacterium]